VLNDDQVRNIINNWTYSEQGINFTITRNGKQLIRKIHPMFCNDTQGYRIGLFVRDNAGGVGTLTFCDPLSKKYGALGHVITDSETNQKLNIRQGKILYASIEDIQKGKTGNPGEKLGVFLDNTEFGDIQKNEMCGIYGSIKKDIKNPLYKDSLQVMYANQIHTGKAQILTVIRGQEIKIYDINIEKVLLNRMDGKNMIIRITDKTLLKETGGIVQGMSGSPIIQDGKIAGAVTHVFINDPSRGYGVFKENMLLEAGIINKYGKQTLGLSPQGFLHLVVNIINMVNKTM
jgi:stage IV sporulation protein B